LFGQDINGLCVWNFVECPLRLFAPSIHKNVLIVLIMSFDFKSFIIPYNLNVVNILAGYFGGYANSKCILAAVNGSPYFESMQQNQFLFKYMVINIHKNEVIKY
jgi:hypothetical protein